MTETAPVAEQRITFHPVEIAPLPEGRASSPGRRPTRSVPSSAVGALPATRATEPEVQYPVMAAEEFDGDATAEYQEELAPIVSADATAPEPAEETMDEAENFAPIISAADFVRPGRATDGEPSSPPDVSQAPMQLSPAPAAAAAEPQTPIPAEPKAQPRGLFSGLRFPEFRSRSSRPARE